MDKFNPEDTVLTTDFKKRIEASNVYLCELHFKPECILTSQYACQKMWTLNQLYIGRLNIWSQLGWVSWFMFSAKGLCKMG